MTPERLAEIEARLKAATPGPWFHDLQFMQVAAEDPSGGSCLYIGAEGGPTDPDADLIANAPTDLADLLAEVQVLSRREPTESEMEAALGSGDEAFIGGTVRRCCDCRRPVFGGPTRCVSCVACAEVRRLTAERATALEAISDAGDYVEGDSLIDSINELIRDTDEIRRQGRRENEAGDIVGEIRPMLGGVDQEGVIRAVAEVVDERDALRARVAELEEAARWRPLGPGPVAP